MKLEVDSSRKIADECLRRADALQAELISMKDLIAEANIAMGFNAQLHK